MVNEKFCSGHRCTALALWLVNDMQYCAFHYDVYRHTPLASWIHDIHSVMRVEMEHMKNEIT